MRNERLLSSVITSSLSHYSERNTAAEPLFNLISMVDIIFTLLMFFMLTSPFVTQWGIKVNLPSVKNVSNVSSSEIEVMITAQGHIFIKGKEFSISLLREELKKLSLKGVPVLITGDKDASLGRTLEVWDIAKEVGIKELNIRTLFKPSK
jgi:biopolymer transport protein ExbD